MGGEGRDSEAKGLGGESEVERERGGGMRVKERCGVERGKGRRWLEERIEVN